MSTENSTWTEDPDGTLRSIPPGRGKALGPEGYICAVPECGSMIAGDAYCERHRGLEWGSCGHRSDFASAAEHERDCPAHGEDAAVKTA